MVYDTSNSLDKANFLLRAKKLAESGKIIELTEKSQEEVYRRTSICTFFLLISVHKQVIRLNGSNSNIIRNSSIPIYLSEKKKISIWAR